MEVGRNKVSLRDGSFKWIPAGAGMTGRVGMAEVGWWTGPSYRGTEPQVGVRARRRRYFGTFGRKRHAHASVGQAAMVVVGIVGVEGVGRNGFPPARE